MGYGSYSASDWNRLKQSRKLSADQNVSEVFARKGCDPKMDPRYIGTRECFDSEEHPNTTPIVIGLDVTGSMGYLAVEIATGALNSLITKLYSTGAVEDPALMCAAYGDYQDSSPLQVTQFESDIRIAEQLLNIYFENGGQSQVALPCLWDFLIRHTNIDAIKKRDQKGFLFTLGDPAVIRKNDVPETIERVVGDKASLFGIGFTREDLLTELKKYFEVVHITINGPLHDGELLCGRNICISQKDISLIPEIIISSIQLFKGGKKSQILEQWDTVSRPVIKAAVDQLNIVCEGEDIHL